MGEFHAMLERSLKKPSFTLWRIFKSKVKYPGRLGKRRSKPWFDGPCLLLLPPKVRDEIMESQAQEEAELLGELLKYYDIDPGRDNCWNELLVCLARDHVPAFKTTKGRPGRPVYWTPEKKKYLVNVIKIYRKNSPELTEKQCVKEVGKVMGYVEGQLDSLYSRYLAFKSELSSND